MRELICESRTSISFAHELNLIELLWFELDLLAILIAKNELGFGSVNFQIVMNKHLAY